MVDTDGKKTYSDGTPIPDLCYVGYGHKKGAPLSPNLLNLKSKTMKNTMQR